MKPLIPLLLMLVLIGCGTESDEPAEGQDEAADQAAAEVESETQPESREETAAMADDRSPSEGRLAQILDAQPDEIKARYDARHPRETLEFFGIEPGMTVVEGLPGGGWYTRILIPLLGLDGHLIAANYPMDIWPHFPFGTEEFMEQMRQWPETFPEEAQAWCEDDCAPVSTFNMGSLPEDLTGTADAVIYARVLHNLARFQNAGVDDYLEQALADAFAVLKPGGIFGVVQHEARAGMPDDWAEGRAGYLKKAFVIERAEVAGFELVDESDINANPNDRPSTDQVVWRLPPSLSVPDDAEDVEALRVEYEAVGESNRMTLKFRKPSAQ